MDASDASSPTYGRHPDLEAAYATEYPAWTPTEPYWQHLPQAEIVADPARRFGLGLRLLSGAVSAEVLAQAADEMSTVAYQLGAVVALNHSPLTGYVSVETTGEAPVFDAARTSPWELEPVLMADVATAATLEDLARLLERNAARAAEQLRALSRAGFGLAELDFDGSPLVIVSQLSWP